jgi:hypothetical protein
MHYHLEIIMPPSSNIKESLEKIMKPFDEETSEKGFWDWYVVGGRFSGEKEMCGYTEEKMKIFYEKLKEKKVTVSSFRAGKQTINPPEQIPMVDKIWNEIFPTENGEIVPCPIFSHSNADDTMISCDICRVEEIPEKLFAERVIIAGPDFEANYMIAQDHWNGVNFVKIDWDGKVKSAIENFIKKCSRYKDEYKEKVIPKSNWICITVDYHS